MLSEACVVGDLRMNPSWLLLVFGVTPFKKDQNKKSKPLNRSSQESGK